MKPFNMGNFIRRNEAAPCRSARISLVNASSLHGTICEALALNALINARPMHNILLVDDDTDLLMILKRSLAGHGYNVTTLSNPSRVQDTVDLVQPEVIILDINMGDWDGRENL